MSGTSELPLFASSGRLLSPAGMPRLRPGAWRAGTVGRISRTTYDGARGVPCAAACHPCPRPNGIGEPPRSVSPGRRPLLMGTRRRRPDVFRAVRDGPFGRRWSGRGAGVLHVGACPV